MKRLLLIITIMPGFLTMMAHTSTISSLTLTLEAGATIKWYAASSGRTALTTSKALVNGTHYYATQTVNCTESVTRLNVTVAISQ